MTGRAFWAIVLILAGIFFLLINLGILPGNAWNYIFPAFLVVLGIALLMGWRGSGSLQVVTESAPLDGATRAAVNLKHGAGRLSIHAGTDPNLLFMGTFAGGVDKSLKRSADTAVLELKTPGDVWSGMGFMGGRGLEWNVGLNPNVPTLLKYEGGAAETRMDLSGMKLAELEINTGASSTDVVLPAPSGLVRVVVKSGAASVKLRLPPNAAASIRGTMGLGALDVDMTRFPGRGAGVFQSDDYAGATDRFDVSVEGGVGSVQIR